ncbi:hypothetical protein BJV74DRAFT_794959 [Russula compacta]|nr:hypothetical protein BJV74DRAFT_794959 [Russula compacta]
MSSHCDWTSKPYSLGWMQLLTHSIPFTNDKGTAFNVEDLQAEVQSLPGLRKVFFTMAPRWLKPRQIHCQHPYEGQISTFCAQGAMCSDIHRAWKPAHLTRTLSSATPVEAPTSQRNTTKGWATTAGTTSALPVPSSAHGTPNTQTETETKVMIHTMEIDSDTPSCPTPGTAKTPL